MIAGENLIIKFMLRQKDGLGIVFPPFLDGMIVSLVQKDGNQVMREVYPSANLRDAGVYTELEITRPISSKMRNGPIDMIVEIRRDDPNFEVDSFQDDFLRIPNVFEVGTPKPETGILIVEYVTDILFPLEISSGVNMISSEQLISGG